MYPMKNAVQLIITPLVLISAIFVHSMIKAKELAMVTLVAL